MSRYEYRPQDWPSHMAFAIGWDPAMLTFFAQVMDYSISRDDDCIVVWLGALLPHFQDVDEIMRELNRQIDGKLQRVDLRPSMRAKLLQNKRKYVRRGTAQGLGHNDCRRSA